MEESTMINRVKHLISRRLPAIFDVNMHVENSLDALPMGLTWAIKAEVGQWLRWGIAQHTRDLTA